ncbi:MAG: hypothetical protein FJ125_18540 [Deltaproteobacteria bacterium]|nr:hypothetical protein [Deltaproteobacteria bacterium]
MPWRFCRTRPRARARQRQGQRPECSRVLHSYFVGHPELLGYLGLTPHCHRLQLHQAVRAQLGPRARSYWDGQQQAIATGVIHAGKLERYFNMVTMLLPTLVLITWLALTSRCAYV